MMGNLGGAMGLNIAGRTIDVNNPQRMGPSAIARSTPTPDSMRARAAGSPITATSTFVDWALMSPQASTQSVAIGPQGELLAPGSSSSSWSWLWWVGGIGAVGVLGYAAYRSFSKRSKKKGAA